MVFVNNGILGALVAAMFQDKVLVAAEMIRDVLEYFRDLLCLILTVTVIPLYLFTDS